MRAAACVVFAIVIGLARADADVTEWKLADQPAGWLRVPDAAVRDGNALRFVDTTVLRHDAPISAATGWSLEVTVAVDAATGGGTVGFSGWDDRQIVVVDFVAGNVRLDGVAVAKLDSQPHTYRLDVSAGRHRLAMDGKPVADTDSEISRYGVAIPMAPNIACSAVKQPPDPTFVTTRWSRVRLDTAPKLAPSKFPIKPLLPLGQELKQLAAAYSELEPSFANLTSAGDACLAFELVRATMSAPPARLSAAELAKAARAVREPPQSQGGAICDPAHRCDCGMCSIRHSLEFLQHDQWEQAAATITNQLPPDYGVTLSPATRKALGRAFEEIAKDPTRCRR